jgi:hypothetical protein
MTRRSCFRGFRFIIASRTLDSQVILVSTSKNDAVEIEIESQLKICHAKKLPKKQLLIQN